LLINGVNYKAKAKLVESASRNEEAQRYRSRNRTGSSCATSLAEQSTILSHFVSKDSQTRPFWPAQGGVNASKITKMMATGTFRMFYDTIKGGDFNLEEANVYRLGLPLLLLTMR
jgi:succinate dehydrogenase / fumarate reductase flavoprotein subunit